MSEAESSSESKGSESNWVKANFERFETQLNGSRNSPVHSLRTAALRTFAASGFPTPQNEEWKYTNVAPIARAALRIPLALDEGLPTAAEIERVSALGDSAVRVVFVNGRYIERLSVLSQLPKGVSLVPLSRAISESASPEEKELVRTHLAKQAGVDEHPFVALNTAFLKEGMLLKVARGVTCEQPIEVLFIMTGAHVGTVALPRLLVVIEESSHLALVENYSGLAGSTYFTSTVSEFVVGENASLEHQKLELEGDGAFHIGNMHVRIAANARVNTHLVSLGGLLVRNEVHLTLQGQGIVASLNGLTAIHKEQHVDNHTVITHAAAHCESRELFKGIYRDKSRGVFNGTIIVHPDAQKTNAIQSNQSLLLSKDAAIDTKPQLKIWADDVKCTHGATVGQLDEEGLFYLRSRGISRDEAVTLMLRAFAGEVLASIGNPQVRSFIEERMTRA